MRGIERRGKVSADPRRTGPPKQGRLERLAADLGIAHERVPLERCGSKLWRHSMDDQPSSVELAVLASYERAGWSGCASEGGLILTLIKAASFPRLDRSDADTFVESLYFHDVPGRLEVATLVANVANADMPRIMRNWEIIRATAGDSPAYYPAVRREHVVGLFQSLGAARLADIARLFATAPYDLRAGWPDLTIWRGDAVRFAEVKSPGDSLQPSQARLVSALLVPLGFDTVLAEVSVAR